MNPKPLAPPLVVFITGASSGLGEALARRHARQGHAVVLFARRAQTLRALALEAQGLGAAGALAVVGDVSRRSDLDKAVRQTLKRFGRIDIVYANAGYGLRGEIAGLNLLQWRQQQAVNVEGVLNTVWACLPSLRASRGRLGLVGSVLGYGVVPGNGAYAASKFAVRALALALRAELKAEGVSVTHIAPGFFESRFRQRDRQGRSDPSVPDSAPRGWRITAQRAAGFSSRAVWARRRETVFPLHGWLTAALFRYWPGLALNLAAWMRRRRLRQ
jgi:NADP-dependent 3-hydroxy acid dehydrogenase YdfG